MNDVFVEKLGNCIREQDYKIVFLYSWKHRIREVTAIRVFLEHGRQPWRAKLQGLPSGRRNVYSWKITVFVELSYS